ncbi:MAG TPA: glycosyltransferase, partial [Flavisolibacter sp.]|nr:glycosyltransferase [Flavisolibacter sp.]
DMNRFENVYGFRRLSFIPCFIPWQEVRSQEGRGNYCLYHGNLSVSENEEAVLWLIRNVFSRVTIPFVIAGNSISKQLVALTKTYQHIMLVNDPPDDEMQALVRDAHIHVLPSFNRTGVKLKLLNALLNGRFCLTNSNGLQGSRIEKGVLVQNEASEWVSTLNDYMQRDFAASDMEERIAILSLYNNRENAQKLNALWMHCR